jgi:hypothetical protein
VQGKDSGKIDPVWVYGIGECYARGYSELMFYYPYFSIAANSETRPIVRHYRYVFFPDGL